MVALNTQPSDGSSERASLEAIAVEGYRSAKLSAGEVARLLGLETSIQALSWLASRGVCMNYSQDDLEDDRAAMTRLIDKPVGP